MQIQLLDDHIIICGWNSSGPQLVEQLLQTSNRQLLIISPVEIEQLDNNRVLYLIGDPTEESTLLTARLRLAHSVVILSDGQTDSIQDADARSILIALAVEQHNPETHSIIELRNPKNAHHARHAQVDEIVVSNAYNGSILAQTAANPGISEVFQELFGNTNISVIHNNIESDWVGKPYSQLANHILVNNIGSAIGLIRKVDSEDIHNTASHGFCALLLPPPTENIGDGDSLVLLAHTS